MIMKDLFLTTTIPCWILFILSLISVGFCFLSVLDRDKLSDDRKISKKAMYSLSGLMLFVAAALIFTHIYVGGRALWWLAPEGAGYISILLHTLILLVFLIVQGIAPFAYKLYMEDYFGGIKLSIKSQFVALVIIVPVALLFFMVIGQFFMEEKARNLWFYIVSATGIGIAALYSFWSNSKAVGKAAGAIYTVTSFVLCVGTLITLLYFLVALFAAFMEMLPLVGTIGALYFLFGSSFSNLMTSGGGSSSRAYYADDGSLHYTSNHRDLRNDQIRSQREGNS